jgi:hypothetical protein
MTKDRRAKVTAETRREAALLRALWDSRPHSTQAEFGEQHGIGNQSAVGQFLRGELPLSLKAARGFATGLGVRVEDFSVRLAAEATAIAQVVPQGQLSEEVAALAAEIDALSPIDRERVLLLCRQIVAITRDPHGQQQNPVQRTAKRQ